MWDLFFRLRADNSPLQRDMAKSSAFFDTWADKQSKKMGETFWKGVSMATVGAVALRGFSAATQAAEDIARMAAETHRTVEEMTLLQKVAQETGKSVTDLVAILQGGGPAAAELKKEMRATTALHPKIGAVYGMAGENMRGLGGALKFGAGALGAIPTSLFNLVAEPFRLFGNLTTALKRRDWGMAKEAFSDSGLRIRSPLEWQEKQIAKRRQMAMPASGDMPEIDSFFKRYDEEVAYRKQVNEGLEESRRNGEAKRVAGLAYMRPSSDADALSRVGIFSARTATEDRQFQRESLNYLAAIKDNTYRLMSTAMPPVDPLDIQP